jgi:hypothetical protein
MFYIARKWVATALVCTAFPALAAAQQDAASNAVQAAALKFAGGVAWRADTVIASDFSCTGKVQQAILGALPDEILVAIFTHGLDQAPEVLRFDAGDRNILASKIRVDDYALSVAEITGVSGAAPAGYRQSTVCHGVRLSDDSSEAAHIYWDHDHQRFDSWTQ